MQVSQNQTQKGLSVHSTSRVFVEKWDTWVEVNGWHDLGSFNQRGLCVCVCVVSWYFRWVLRRGCSGLACLSLELAKAQGFVGNREAWLPVRPSQGVSWAFVCIWPVLNVKSFWVFRKYIFRSGSEKFLLNISKYDFLYDCHTVNCVSRHSPN